MPARKSEIVNICHEFTCPICRREWVRKPQSDAVLHVGVNVRYQGAHFKSEALVCKLCARAIAKVQI